MTIKYTGLYGITDHTLMPNDHLLLTRVEQALKGGITLLQYRNKNPLDVSEPLRQVRKLMELCHDYNVPLIINDDVDLAIKVKAQGVHLGAYDMSLAKARSLLGEKAIIGATCKNSVSRAIEAQRRGASYVAFGRFFPSMTKPNATPASLEIIGEAKKHCHLPVVAIGGITTNNCQQVLESGADIIAVVHSLFAHDNVKSQAQRFNQYITAGKMACEPSCDDN